MELIFCEKIAFESYSFGKIRGVKLAVPCQLSPFIFVLHVVFIFNCDMLCLFDKNLGLTQPLTWPIFALCRTVSCHVIMFYL